MRSAKRLAEQVMDELQKEELEIAMRASLTRMEFEAKNHAYAVCDASGGVQWVTP